MSTVKKIFAQTAYIAGHDLAKRWFVRIKIPDYKKGRLAWQKCYGDINKYETVEERLEAINKLMVEIELHQEYVKTQGSRNVGYENENYYTSTIFQFKKQLEARRYRIRISTHRRYRGLIKNLEAWLVKIDKVQLAIGIFSNNDAREFLRWIVADKHQSNESHNQHLRLFKSFCVESINEGIIKTNPFNGIKGMPKQNTPALYFGKSQIAILKEEIPRRDAQLWVFVNFMYYVFIRPGELRQLLINDINFSEGRIRLRPEITKNKKLQYVSIPAQLSKLLQEAEYSKFPKEFYVFGNKGVPGPVQLSVNSMKERHQPILKSLGFSIEHKLYSWKHTGAVACARAGMPLKDLQMQLRHHSLDQVDKYLKSMLVWESEFIINNYPTI